MNRSDPLESPLQAPGTLIKSFQPAVLIVRFIPDILHLTRIVLCDCEPNDVFESVVATILKRDGFWVRTSLKVKLAKEVQREIGWPSSPRWEIDIVGCRPGDCLLRMVECKSCLYSRGVIMAVFDPTAWLPGFTRLNRTIIGLRPTDRNLQPT